MVKDTSKKVLKVALKQKLLNRFQRNLVLEVYSRGCCEFHFGQWVHCNPSFTWTLLPKLFTRLEKYISLVFVSYFTIQEVSISSYITIVSGKNPILWDVMSYSLLEICPWFISITCCQISTKIYGVTFQKTAFFILTAIGTLDFTLSQWVSQQGVHH
jgi:hypothetical protein